jgi:hypothetical protein
MADIRYTLSEMYEQLLQEASEEASREPPCWQRHPGPRGHELYIGKRTKAQNKLVDQFFKDHVCFSSLCRESNLTSIKGSTLPIQARIRGPFRLERGRVFVEDGEMVVLPLFKGDKQLQARVVLPPPTQGSVTVQWDPLKPVHIKEKGFLESESGVSFMTVQFPRKTESADKEVVNVDKSQLPKPPK